ncbi:sensor histidine kinase [Paucibacter sp. Y2R2-4]|uniref:sensor histidine kinase n=1 Tax=Paucibacter sp. Y2R2-4 TaxID=2893553 RepID=UPI0021E4640C|nr:PAS domain-containing protein [Paucibacter sp. Y2R2-4]MCV2351813.1 PAS domain-containing protein [Paucibacter sp. Y2R2-4]
MNSSVDEKDPLWFSTLQTIFGADSPVGKAVLDRGLRYVFINQTLAAFNGRSIEEHLGRTVEDILPEAFSTLAPLLRSVLDAGARHAQFRVSVEMPNSPGEFNEWEASYLPIQLPDGTIGGVYVQAVNLTAELRAQQALANSEKQLRRVLDSLFAFVGVMTPDGTLIEANKAPLEAAGVDAKDVIGRPFWDTYWWNYSVESQDWMHQACVRAAQGEVVREDVTARMAGDTRMALDFMLVPMRDDYDRITHLIPSAIDISARQAAQVRTESALKERTVLLQEVHHRVKNNLQIIASLLNLQARGAAPEAQQALQDSQNRVMAMALTHQLLYERNDFSSLQLGPYLRRLVASLRDVHGEILRRVSLNVEAPDSGLSIDLNQAVPVALVVNELLINALKHGFGTDGLGAVAVRAGRQGHCIVIAVADTGLGMPVGFELNSGASLGLRLVTLLTEQLQATMHWPVAGQAGAVFTLQLPPESTPL